MIKAVIFDFDGTILDTETPWFDAYVEMYDQHGATLTLDVYSKIIGTNSKNKDFIDPYGNLERQINKKLDHQQLRDIISQRHTELMNEQKIRPGIMSYLKEAKELNMKIGLASSSHADWVTRYLKALDIEKYFEVVMTADQVENVKPDPELYIKALNELGVSGKEALAIEDSPNGTKAAVDAGIYTLIIPNKVTDTMEFVNGYHMKLHSLEEMSLSKVIASIHLQA